MRPEEIAEEQFGVPQPDQIHPSINQLNHSPSGNSSSSSPTSSLSRRSGGGGHSSTGKMSVFEDPPRQSSPPPSSSTPNGSYHHRLHGGSSLRTHSAPGRSGPSVFVEQPSDPPVLQNNHHRSNNNNNNHHHHVHPTLDLSPPSGSSKVCNLKDVTPTGVPTLTFSPETPPALSAPHLSDSFNTSSASSSSSPSKVFSANLFDMKPTPPGGGDLDEGTRNPRTRSRALLLNGNHHSGHSYNSCMSSNNGLPSSQRTSCSSSSSNNNNNNNNNNSNNNNTSCCSTNGGCWQGKTTVSVVPELSSRSSQSIWKSYDRGSHGSTDLKACTASNRGGGSALLNCENSSGAGNHSHSSSNISAEEKFECVGEGPESFLDSHSENTSLQFSRDVSDSSSLSVTVEGSGAPPIRRNSWLRTSLRKSPQHSGSSPNGEMGHRRWGSFRNSSGIKRVPPVTSSSALANQLYRSSSFHSSGRSSAGDGEEMYSDGSLEDEVIDLTQKVHHLEEKFSVLAENQTDVDDRYVRIKQENAELSTKLFMAEESLRDVEQRAEEKLKDEQRRFKDTLARAEREKHLQMENYDIRLRSAEKDLEQAGLEVTRLKQKLEKERNEKILTKEKLSETERELGTVREDHRALIDVLRKERDTYLLEAKTAQQALLEVKKEFELSKKERRLTSSSDSHHRPGHSTRLSSVDSESESAELRSRLSEFEEENKHLKQQNRQLQEANEELSAQILNHGLEEGRHLLTVNRNVGDIGNSLAAEFEAMSQEQLKKALKEQTEVNEQLKTYIDGILLNIVENYPQLLEVKNKSTPENSLEQSS